LHVAVEFALPDHHDKKWQGKGTMVKEAPSVVDQKTKCLSVSRMAHYLAPLLDDEDRRTDGLDFFFNYDCAEK
jgi:hypothetical protein